MDTDAVGGRHFKDAPPSDYEKQVEQAVSAIKQQVNLLVSTNTGNKSSSEQSGYICCSFSMEQRGLTGLEALPLALPWSQQTEAEYPNMRADALIIRLRI